MAVELSDSVGDSEGCPGTANDLTRRQRALPPGRGEAELPEAVVETGSRVGAYRPLRQLILRRELRSKAPENLVKRR